MAKSKYVQERDFEKKSTIRWRGRWWLQIPTFLLFVAGGVVAAIVVGTIGKVIYYGATSGIWNWMTQLWGVQTFPPYDANYFQFLIVQSLSGQDLFENNSWVLSIVMLIAFLIPTVYGAQKWWSWTQLYSDRTLNFNRFANLKEIDRTYELVPDRNKFYTGETGPQMSHISGYSLSFARLHPILWLKQISKAPLGLNREVFPKWYQSIRPALIKIFPHGFQRQLSVKGGFEGFYYIDNKPTHMEVLGVTRAGKDQRLGYPSIDILRRTDLKNQPNIVDTDAKNEDAKMSYRPLREAGYDVQLVNIQDTDWSESWNPLEVALNYAEDGEWVKATDEVMVVVQILGEDTSGGNGDSFWDNVAQDMQIAIILVLLWLAVEHNDSSIVSPNNMIQVVNDLSEFDDPENENEDGLTRYFKNLAKLDPRPPVINEALNRAASFLGAKGATKASAKVSFQQRSRLFANETVALLTSHSTIRLSDYGFSRLFKLKMSTPEYAGLTTTVKLIDRSKDKVIEKDTLKVSRAGVVQYPFKSVFPESWAIEVSFENKNNPVHFRKDIVSITGLKRHAKNIKGELKSMQNDSWGNKTLLKLTDPDTLQPNQLIRVNSAHLLNYVEDTSKHTNIIFFDSTLLQDSKYLPDVVMESLKKKANSSQFAINDDVSKNIIAFIEQYHPVTFVFENFTLEGLDNFIYECFVDKVMVHFDEITSLPMCNVIVGIETESETYDVKRFDNQVLRIKNDNLETFLDTQKISQNVKIIDGSKLKSYDDFLVQTYKLFDMAYIEYRNANGLIDWLTDSHYVGPERQAIIFGIKNFNDLTLDLQTNIQLTIDGNYGGVLQYWDDEVVSTSDQKYRRFTFMTSS